MWVLGVLVFAAQMIDFTIPVTDSSGHPGGAMVLAIPISTPREVSRLTSGI